MMTSGFSRHGVEARDGGGHFGRAGLALHAHRPDQHMAREAVIQAVQDVADHGARGRGDDADDLRQIGNGLLARRIEQALGGELLLALFQQRHQRADARRLDVLDDDLVVGLHAGRR